MGDLALLAVHFANITDHGPQFLGFMGTREPELYAIAEHHRPASELEELRHRYRHYLGYRSFWSEAAPTGKGGTHGGTPSLLAITSK